MESTKDNHPRTKQTTMEEIHAEEIEFLGREIDFNLEDRGSIAGRESIQVTLLQPFDYHGGEGYAAWAIAALRTALTTWASEEGSAQIDSIVSESEVHKRLVNILKQRPISAVLESVAFSFNITGLPRSITHQIVRHRGMSFNQESFRVSSCYGADVRLPQHIIDSITRKRELLGALKTGTREYEIEERALGEMLLDVQEFYDYVNKGREIYKKWIGRGVPVEESRNVMPMGTTTSIVAVMRLREVLQYLRDRTQEITQGEHHYLVSRIMAAIRHSAPNYWHLICELAPNAEEVADLPVVDPVDLELLEEDE